MKCHPYPGQHLILRTVHCCDVYSESLSMSRTGGQYSTSGRESLGHCRFKDAAYPTLFALYSFKLLCIHWCILDDLQISHKFYRPYYEGSVLNKKRTMMHWLREGNITHILDLKQTELRTLGHMNAAHRSIDGACHWHHHHLCHLSITQFHFLFTELSQLLWNNTSFRKPF